MKQLINLIPLNHKVAIYVPSTVKVDKKVSNRKQVDATLTRLSQLFGGATSTKAQGSWVTETGKLVKEQITVVYAYCTEDLLQAHINDVTGYCEALKAEMEQEAISLEVDNQLYFI